MTYYINPILFYLMDIAAVLQAFLLIIGGAVIVFTIVILIIAFDCTDIQAIKKNIIVGIILLFIGILIPSKETCIEMLVASQVTHENVSDAKEEIYKIIDYIADKVNGKENEE